MRISNSCAAVTLATLVAIGPLARSCMSRTYHAATTDSASSRMLSTATGAVIRVTNREFIKRPQCSTSVSEAREAASGPANPVQPVQTLVGCPASEQAVNFAKDCGLGTEGGY